MRLNDVWKKANQQVGFYTTDNFDKVPTLPGVYGWFYPLRITTSDLNDFITQVNLVLNYDSTTLGKPVKNSELIFSWQRLNVTAELTDPQINISNFISTWNSLFKSDRFDEFRKIIMKSSIFLPPLYVGKTTTLYNRCFQHINGDGSSNSFNTRFTKYANSVPNSTAKKVSELLFVCITTEELTEYGQDVEGLVEGILKHLSKPKYSKL